MEQRRAFPKPKVSCVLMGSPWALYDQRTICFAKWTSTVAPVPLRLIVYVLAMR